MKRINLFLLGLIISTISCTSKTTKVASLVKQDAINYVLTNVRNDFTYDTIIVVHKEGNNYEGILRMRYSPGMGSSIRVFPLHITYDGSQCLFTIEK